MNTPTIWKSKKGDVSITEMATPHIANSIAKVEKELNESTVTDRAGKESILAALKTEFDARPQETTTTV